MAEREVVDNGGIVNGKLVLKARKRRGGFKKKEPKHISDGSPADWGNDAVRQFCPYGGLRIALKQASVTGLDMLENDAEQIREKFPILVKSRDLELDDVLEQIKRIAEERGYRGPEAEVKEPEVKEPEPQPQLEPEPPNNEPVQPELSPPPLLIPEADFVHIDGDGAVINESGDEDYRDDGGVAAPAPPDQPPEPDVPPLEPGHEPVYFIPVEPGAQQQQPDDEEKRAIIPPDPYAEDEPPQAFDFGGVGRVSQLRHRPRPQQPREIYNSERYPPPEDYYVDYGNTPPPATNQYLPDLAVRYPQHPPTNGPRFRARMDGSDPADQPMDEPTDHFNEADARRQYGGNLSQLEGRGKRDTLRNLRLLTYYSGSVERVLDYYQQTCSVVKIGDRVIRDIDWIWGNQDSCNVPYDPYRYPNESAGRDNHFGVVRSIRKWHPNSGHGTEVVVQWDNTYVGNYRFGHLGAYDVRITARGPQINVRDLRCGDTVRRGAAWRNGDEDGGQGSEGIVEELYSAPTTFERGVRVAVMWDKDEEHWLKQIAGYRHEVQLRRSQPGYSIEDEVAEEKRKFPEGRWVEPDLLHRPPIRYRWGVDDAYDLWPVETERRAMDPHEYLQVTDQVIPGPDHEHRPGEPVGWDESTVMTVDQWDPLTYPVVGDRITVLHNPKVKYRFNYLGKKDCDFGQRGEDFAAVPLKVGDRVQRGFDWDRLQEYYEQEDGGEGSKGTVTAINYVCAITSMLAKIRWENGNVNMYGWGWKNRYELRRMGPPRRGGRR